MEDFLVMQPLIGLTSSYFDPEALGKESLSSYARKVERAGGVPVHIPCGADEASIAAWAEELDGVLFTGGPDIGPERYGEAPSETVEVVAERDEVEFKVFDAFYGARKPILGVCRGAQLMNVFFGGSLIQDIPSEADASGRNYLRHTRGDVRGTPVHGVTTVGGTRLAEILGGSFRVNSIHHQAARKPGEGLVVAAFSEDGLIEGVERPGYPFMVGVQWHPESLDEEPHFRIFEAFIAAASKPPECSPST
jgi:putative glutamine amidotransferase